MTSVDTSRPFEPADDLDGLDALRDRLAADLEAQQGAANRAPWRATMAIVVPAAVAAVLALVGVAVAPRRPGLGERIAQLAVPVAVAAFAAELWRMVPGGVAGTAACLSSTSVVAVFASIGIVLGLWSSGLPLRAWHKAAVAVVAVVGACAAVWHHCRSDELGHVLIAHIGGPVLLMLAVFIVVGRRAPTTVR